MDKDKNMPQSGGPTEEIKSGNWWLSANEDISLSNEYKAKPVKRHKTTVIDKDFPILIVVVNAHAISSIESSIKGLANSVWKYRRCLLASKPELCNWLINFGSCHMLIVLGSEKLFKICSWVIEVSKVNSLIKSPSELQQVQ